MQSATTGIHTVRFSNPVMQGYDRSPEGDLVGRWVPELAGMEGRLVHEPWQAPQAPQLLDQAYPSRLLITCRLPAKRVRRFMASARATCP